MVCPSVREAREIQLAKIAGDYHVVFHPLSSSYFEPRLYHDDSTEAQHFNMKDALESSLAELARFEVNGVINAVDHPGSALAAIFARHLGLPGPDPEVVVRCQHKFYARIDQKRLVPSAVPDFALVAPSGVGALPLPLPLPFFVKPVKGRFSAFATAITDLERWQNLKERPFLPPSGFRRGFNALLDWVGHRGESGDFLLAESMLRGVQVTLDGYVFRGEPTILGITDSIMYPGTISFARFQYPSALPGSVQARMGRIAETYMKGIGFDNGMFNIEFFYNAETDEIHLIEMNPRLASGFADLYEKVDGCNLFEIAMDIATGTPPRFHRGAGKHAVSASFVWRVFRDHFVHSVPGSDKIDAIVARFPDARVEISAEAGKRLSHKLQDTASFRYCLLNLGAADEKSLFEMEAIGRVMLPFDMEPVS